MTPTRDRDRLMCLRHLVQEAIKIRPSLSRSFNRHGRYRTEFRTPDQVLGSDVRDSPLSQDLSERRRRRGLSQVEFARRLRSSQSRVAKMEARARPRCHQTVCRPWRRMEPSRFRSSSARISQLADKSSRPRMMSMPAKTVCSRPRDTCPTLSVRSCRSTAINWETLATESLGNPVARAGRLTLPGASTKRRLLVSGTTMTVAIRLRLKASP